MTVVYGPEDALYGTGQYGVARYGSVGPTKQVTGVSATLSTGSLTGTGKANKTLIGYSISSNVGIPLSSGKAVKSVSGVSASFDTGEPTVTSINRVLVLGVSAEFSLGDVTAEGGTGYTAILDGFSLDLDLGTVKPNLVTFVSGIPATVTLGTLTKTGKATAKPNGLLLSIDEGDPTTTGVIFNFNQFADKYSTKRTVYIPKTHVPEVA